MIRRPPRSTQSRSSAASDVYKRDRLRQIAAGLGALPRQVSADSGFFSADNLTDPALAEVELYVPPEKRVQKLSLAAAMREKLSLLYTSDAADDLICIDLG